MIILGLILFVLGYVLAIGVLMTLGEILLVVGIILAILSALGHPVGGRTWW